MLLIVFQSIYVPTKEANSTQSLENNTIIYNWQRNQSQFRIFMIIIIYNKYVILSRNL